MHTVISSHKQSAYQKVRKSLFVFIYTKYVSPFPLCLKIVGRIELNCNVSDKRHFLTTQLGNNKQECNQINIMEKGRKMELKMKIWSQRGLTLLDKVLISKTFWNFKSCL